MMRQAGLQPQPWAKGLRSSGLLLQCVVLRVYLPTDPQHPGYVPETAAYGPVVDGKPGAELVRRYTPGVLKATLCDVLSYSGRFRGPPMRLVPVMDPWGRSDVGGGWTPRGCTTAAAYPTGAVPDVDPAELDGDVVLVGFLEDSLQQPVILGRLHHPRAEELAPTWRARSATQGPASSYVVRHRGAKLAFDSDGNVTLDTSGASSGAVGPTGSEIPGVYGDVTIRGKASRVVQILDSPIHLRGSARQVARKADSTSTALDAVDVAAWITALCGLLTAAGIPAPAPHADWAAFALYLTAAGLPGQITSGSANVLTD